MTEVTTYIQIGNATIDSKNVKTRPTDRKFRNAWRLEGDVITLDKELLKPIAVAKVNEWRDAQAQKEIVVGGVTYAADPFSTDMINRATQLAEKIENNGGVFETEWSDVNGKGVVMNRAKIDSIGVALGVRTSNLHMEARTKKNTITNATTVDEILAVLDTLK